VYPPSLRDRLQGVEICRRRPAQHRVERSAVNADNGRNTNITPCTMYDSERRRTTKCQVSTLYAIGTEGDEWDAIECGDKYHTYGKPCHARHAKGW
jgi:hypothetical protein